MKLVPELSANWGVTIKPVYGAGVWDKYRKESYAKAGHKCEICGESGLNQGFKHPVECHEIWSWDMDNALQTLEGLISLCPLCHKAIHFGLHGREQAIERMVYVNGMTKEEAQEIISIESEKHVVRSRICWDVDFTKVGLGFLKYEDSVEIANKQREKRVEAMHKRNDEILRKRGIEPLKREPVVKQPKHKHEIVRDLLNKGVCPSQAYDKATKIFNATKED